MQNYEYTKNVIRALINIRLTGCEAAICFYLLDELYGRTDGKKIESASYHHIAKCTNFEERQVRRAVKTLVQKQIVRKQVYATKFGNAYVFINPEVGTSKTPQVRTLKS